MVIHKDRLLPVGQPKDQGENELAKRNKEPAQGGTVYHSGQVSLVFADCFCHGIVVSYANIYTKEGIMQNIVPYININLTFISSGISIYLG